MSSSLGAPLLFLQILQANVYWVSPVMGRTLYLSWRKPKQAWPATQDVKAEQ